MSLWASRNKPQPQGGFERVDADARTGLSALQVQQRGAAGAGNAAPAGITPSVGKIIFKNVCTLFNLLNFLLAVAILLVGSPSNTLFFGVAICNTAMGIFQELRAKRTLDALSILARGKVRAVRDGAEQEIDQQQVVPDDVLILAAGGQVVADCVVLEAEGLEVDEALLTGEADHKRKQVGDKVLSGSFVVAGTAHVRVSAVGAFSYAGGLAVQAKQQKAPTTPLMHTLKLIIRVLAIAIVPIGGLLFYAQYTGGGQLQPAVLGTSAAMIGMIPEGLMLLTGVTLMVGAMKLAKHKALVQSLPSIETLARVDVLCLDKTGTITDGTMGLEELIGVQEGTNPAELGEALGQMMAALPDDNATAKLLREKFKAGEPWQLAGIVPFSSARKWSAAAFAGRGAYVLGAPNFVLPQGGGFAEAAGKYAEKGLRVLCLAHTSQPLPADGLPGGLSCLGLVVLSDTIRPTAAQTFRFFAGEGVTLKVISGDDARTVSAIAARVGIAGAEKFIDMATVQPEADFAALAAEYTVFGRVTPEQKKALVAGLKQAGHTVCMTGDGVNDVLAMKEANCAVAMLNGSDAARGVCDFVLMSSDFSTMVQVLREGRRVINNIENVASLYLVKTIYSAVLALLYFFLPFNYPFEPLQMTPISALMVGVPSFFLALRPNYSKPQGRFLANVLENSLPAALSVVFCVLVVQLMGVLFGLTALEVATMDVLLTGGVCFYLLLRVARPLRAAETGLLALLAAAFVLAFVLAGNFFHLGSLFTRNAIFYGPMLALIPLLFALMARLVRGVRGVRRVKGKDPSLRSG